MREQDLQKIARRIDETDLLLIGVRWTTKDWVTRAVAQSLENQKLILELLKEIF